MKSAAARIREFNCQTHKTVDKRRYPVKHYIIIKYKETVTKADKERLLGEIKKLFEQTLQISGVNGVNVYPCCIDRENRYDVMIEMDMEKEALSAYDESKWHKLWKQNYAEYLEKKTIFDHEG